MMVLPNKYFLRLFIAITSLLVPPCNLLAQQTNTQQKVLELEPHAAKTHLPAVSLLPSEVDMETGNAVPVLLRMVYEQQNFMKDTYPKLHEYAELNFDDPKLDEISFDRFAEQIIRAGSMSFADWQYPLRSERPYSILLPDLQSQRQLVGRGMTIWIKQRLARGKTDEALEGIKAQLACARHCAATPVIVCHLVGLSIANAALDNLELAMQSSDCPNLYWSLANLPPTLQEIGSMVRWEIWATPTRLNEPLPPIGDKEWVRIAGEFVDLFAEISSDRYSHEEGEKLQANMDRIAMQELAQTVGFTDVEIQRMTKEERIMRWLYLNHLRFRTQLEPLAYQSPQQVLAAKRKLDAFHQTIIETSGARTSPYPIVIPQAILACRSFERRIKFLQTIEALRHHASLHEGQLPARLDELELEAPNDPFTNKPFIYEVSEKVANLRQAEIKDFTTTLYDYEVRLK
jgi:hypothetical protein